MGQRQTLPYPIVASHLSHAWPDLPSATVVIAGEEFAFNNRVGEDPRLAEQMHRISLEK
jgi:hypothetical protein